MKKQIVPLIIIVVVAVGIGSYFIFQKTFSDQPQTKSDISSTPEITSELNTIPKTETASKSDVTSTIVSKNTRPLFGTMLAFNINDAAISTQSIMNTLKEGWTEFRKDNSAYTNLKKNLEKLIQSRTKLLKTTDFQIDREVIPYFVWNVIEPQKGQYDWELTDIYVKGIKNASVKISAVIQPFASWDQKNTQQTTGCNALDFAYYDFKAGPPNDWTAYENFLKATVKRYKDVVSVWEIGNEYDGQCGGYKNDPEGYLKLLKTSYTAIKEIDPEAKVLNGGALEFTENSIRNFWTKFFQLGGGQYIDYFNFHFNAERSASPKLDTATFLEVLTFFNNQMEKNGGKKPLYLTEFGIYSGAPSSKSIDQYNQEQKQVQTDLSAQLTQQTPSGQSTNLPSSDPCGDGICDDFEKKNPDTCPQDCDGSAPSGNSEQPSEQQTQGQSLSNLSETEQAELYYQYSILAFANGVSTIFIDLIGQDNDLTGSSSAFDIDNEPRLFLTTLKTTASKLSGFSKVEKISNSQYKFIVDGKAVDIAL